MIVDTVSLINIVVLDGVCELSIIRDYDDDGDDDDCGGRGKL